MATATMDPAVGAEEGAGAAGREEKEPRSSEAQQEEEQRSAGPESSKREQAGEADGAAEEVRSKALSADFLGERGGWSREGRRDLGRTR